jgi:hypothetical protein
MRTVAKWRIALAALIVLAAGILAAQLVPVYFRNMRLQQFVAETARDHANLERPDDLLRATVLNEAERLSLPVRAGNITIQRTPDSVRIDVRYVVKVEMPLYRVDLHFYPGAGSR